METFHNWGNVLNSRAAYKDGLKQMSGLVQHRLYYLIYQWCPASTNGEASEVKRGVELPCSVLSNTASGWASDFQSHCITNMQALKNISVAEEMYFVDNFMTFHAGLFSW